MLAPDPEWGGQDRCPALIYGADIISRPLSVEDCLSDASRCLEFRVGPAPL